MKLPALDDKDKDRIVFIIVGLMVITLAGMIQSCTLKKECIKRSNCSQVGIK